MEIVTGSSVTLRNIFETSWSDFVVRHKDHPGIRDSVIKNVDKILKCNTGSLGFSVFACRDCGSEKAVPFTCKSRFCSSCGKVACDDWMNRVISWSLPNVQYRHIVFTIPSELRSFMLEFRSVGLNTLLAAAKDTLLYVFESKYACLPGIITVCHTFGKDLKWHPHVHAIVSNGGLSSDHQSWIDADYFMPYKLLVAAWKYQLISRLREVGPQVLSDKKLARFQHLLSHLYPRFWYVYTKGLLKSLEFTIRYIGRYAKKPVLAQTRLVDFDGKSVSFQIIEKCKATGKKVSRVITLPVNVFIGKLIRHIPQLHHRLIRYSGIFASRVKGKLLPLAKAALDLKLTHYHQLQAFKECLKLNWRERIKALTRTDPLECPGCSGLMILVRMVINTSSGFRVVHINAP